MEDVRNPEGIWINSRLFREVGDFWMKNGYYTAEPEDSPAYIDFWSRERDRCINGYSIGGAKITGSHYFYLNYCPIDKVEVIGSGRRRAAKKTTGLPDFWEGDYNYFWIRDIARLGILEAMGCSPSYIDSVYNIEDDKERNKILMEHYDKLGLMYQPIPENLDGGLDLIVGKSRRKGFSYKNAACACNNFFHRPKSRTLVMGYEKKYLYPGIDTFFGKCQSYINHINDNTGWKQPTDYINKQNHIRASYKQKNADGLEVEKGILSEIFAISFKDNPDAGRGSDTYDIFGEEVGAWGVPGGLKDTISAMRSSTEAGAFKTGMITLFGTSGDLDKGTVDFAEMFESPQAFNFMAFYDIWGKYHDKVEGFFFPRQLNCEGYMDDNGNSDIQGATDYELRIREQKKKGGATSVQLQKKMYEDPLNSAEAFGIVAHNAFPVVELKAQLDKVIAMKWQESKGTPVRFSREDGRVVAKPVMDGSAEPITTYILKSNNLEGCPVIYEFPGENIPRGLYKIGYDPIRQDTGTSLAAIIVYKSAGIGEFYHDNIVAEYIGRYEDPEDIDRVAEDMADYFNTTIMYENECTGTKNYFRKIRRLSLLALQPDAVISKNLKGSKVSRVYGCHMVEGLKDAGERYIKSWLMSIIDYDENDNPITVIDRIYSRRLLEELINYNRKGNFDLVSALIMCMFQVQNDSMTDNFTEEREPQAKILLNMIGNMYIKN